MTKLKRFLRSSARPALKLFIASLILSSCSSSTTPTYPTESMAEAIEDVSRKEYNTQVTARLVGQTLWVYVPVEGLLERAQKPQKYTEKFSAEHDTTDITDSGIFKIRYNITPISEKEKYQLYTYNKEAVEKINGVWRVLRRVIFSTDRRADKQPVFFCFVTADIKTGFEVRELFYLLDLKKLYYEYISWGEYQHRATQESTVSPEIVGDRTGAHLDYRDITMKEFIVKQINHRIQLKFQKPEVEQSADIDKEILKVAVHTIRMYNFRDFSVLQLDNAFTRRTLVLNSDEVWANPVD